METKTTNDHSHKTVYLLFGFIPILKIKTEDVSKMTKEQSIDSNLGHYNDKTGTFTFFED